MQRKHTSVEQGKARAPDNLRPGEKWMVDGGDATVRSKWGSYRYFLLFTCAKTSYNIIYYLKDNSARSYVAALKYVDRLVRLRKGYGVKTLYGDFFSTPLDQNVLGARDLTSALSSKLHLRTCIGSPAMQKSTCVS